MNQSLGYLLNAIAPLGFVFQRNYYRYKVSYIDSDCGEASSTEIKSTYSLDVEESDCSAH